MGFEDSSHAAAAKDQVQRSPALPLVGKPHLLETSLGLRQEPKQLASIDNTFQ